MTLTTTVKDILSLMDALRDNKNSVLNLNKSLWIKLLKLYRSSAHTDLAPLLASLGFGSAARHQAWHEMVDELAENDALATALHTSLQVA